MDDAIRVLHVDDDTAFLDMVADFLERTDARIDVTSARSGNVALNRLNERSIDCVVSDYEMPGMNGLELLEAVRNNESHLPFILFTGKGSESIASDAIVAGVTDYLQKGGRADTFALLANRIRNAVENYRNEKALRETQERFRILVQESTDVILILAPDGTIEFATSTIERITGRPRDELIGEDGFSHIHPDDIKNVRSQFERLLKSPEERVAVRFRFFRTDESTVEVEARGRNLVDHPLIEGLVVYIRPETSPPT